MNAVKLSAGLLSLALASGIGVVARAQDGPPPPPQYGNQPQYPNQPPPPQYGDQGRDRRDENPGMSAGFHDGFDNGRKDANDHHTFVPEKAFRRNGRPRFQQEFGGRRDLYHAYHDGFIRGYERGYRGGDMDDHHDHDH